MVFDKDEMLTIISQEDPSIDRFLEHLEKEYPKLKNDNLVLDLLSFTKLTPYNVVAFLEISRKHRKNGKSFVKNKMFNKALSVLRPDSWQKAGHEQKISYTSAL